MEFEIQSAQARIDARNVDDEFTVRELYGETEWAKVENPNSFGKAFKHAVQSGNLKRIVHNETHPSKRRDIYIRTK